ncbi:MAG: ImmA/IrrE family metallo-endopeptidase [Trueperaceae bacterium]|nr:ImmA/IrrE family metallo-endopeptidase [Trueperaceae bacterium]
MEITAEELGRRLRVAREVAEVTQEVAASHLGLTRGALAQVESGMRAPNSLQLVELARLYALDPGDLLRAEFEPRSTNALQALFRAEAAIADDAERARAVRECAELRRDFLQLEEMLGVERRATYPVRYETPALRARYDAVRQGEALAASERGRLGLGDEAITSLVELLQSQGIWVAQVDLPDNISGFTLHDPADGIAVFVNAGHVEGRRRFSYAHEYCHAVADWKSESVVSRVEDRTDLPEVRANAFAAAFLLPPAGVRAFVESIGKGRGDRSLRIFDEREAVTARERLELAARPIGPHDVGWLASYFGVSYEAATYRLQNIGLVTNDERERLAAQRHLASGFGIAARRPEPEGPALHARLVNLALDALRAGLISAGRFRELCLRAGIDIDQIDEVVMAVQGDAEAPGGEAITSSGAVGA